MNTKTRFRRRTIIKLLTGGLLSSGLGASLSGCTHKKFFHPDEEILLSGGSYKDGNTQQNALIAINLTQQEKRVIDTGFLPHEIIIHPADKHRVYCFEKNGINACEINLQTQTVSRKFQSEEGQTFSGHAAFSKDGKVCYCVENDKNNNQGSFSIRDSKTFKILKRLPTLGLSAHDCQLLNDSSLVISNTGKSDSGFHQPSLVAIELISEKLIKRIKLTDENLNCGHFAITKTGDLVIASAPLTSSENDIGGVSIQHNNKLSTMSEPDAVIKRMTGEALSIEISQQQNIAAITHPQANLITFWSITEGNIIKAYGIETPRGLSQTNDKRHFIISYGKKPAMAKISTKDLTPVANSIVQPTLATGEHLVNWGRTLRQIMPTQIYS